MEWRPIIRPEELGDYYTLFPQLKNNLYTKLVTSFLQRLSGFLQYPVGILMEPDLEEFEGDLEALRALRMLKKFREAGFVGSFYHSRHDYGDEPNGYVTMARLKSIKRFGFSGKGTDLFDRSKTLWPAVGEAVERYAMQFHYPVDGEYLDAAYDDITEPKTNIFDIAGFDEALREKGHHDFILKYDTKTNFRWVKAITLPEKKEVWAPLQWFSFTHVQKYASKSKAQPPQLAEPLLSIPITTGVAAGQNTTDALLRGLLEVIERDAFIIYWLNQLPAKQIDLSSCKNPKIREMDQMAKKYGFEMYTLYLQTDMPVHTIGCVLIDRSGIGPALIIGAKTSLDIEEGIYSVLSDTLAGRGSYRKMMDSEEYQKQDFSDTKKIGHVERIYYWFSTERLQYVDQFIKGELVRVDELPAYNYSKNNEYDLASLLQFFKQKGYEVLYRELLDEKMKRLTEGMSVTMVKVPKMQPLYLEESLVSLNGERLHSIPEQLGYPRKNSIDEFFKVPHPFP